MAPENTPFRMDPVAPVSPSVNEQAARQTMVDWEQLGRQQVVASPLAETPFDSIDLKPPKLEADRKKEKKKRVVHEWARGVWMRRALTRTRDRAREKQHDSKSPTVRGLWKMADVTIGMVLNAPNKAIMVPAKRQNAYRRYGTDKGVSSAP
jgi:hypothetical protein